MRPTRAPIAWLASPTLDQPSCFTGRDSGTSQKAFVAPMSTRSHFWRKSSTFFVTRVMGLSSAPHAMGM